MAKSRIIKDLANNNVDLLTALKRTKVLLFELDDREIIEWVNNEITGYPQDADIPSYRKTMGRLVGSYIMAGYHFQNASIPLGEMPEDIQEELLLIKFREGVDSLKSLYESGNKLSKPIPADLFPTIIHYNGNPFMKIISANVIFANSEIVNVFSAVENKLLDILMILEKKFGILDELDIDLSKEHKDEIREITEKIKCIIYNDNRISIGDNNRIRDTKIATSNNMQEYMQE